MMFTKMAHIRELVKGLEFTSKDGSKLNNIIDPTIVATFIRNIYVTVVMFNLINVQPVHGDERLILYNLWTMAGLKYRQTFVDFASADENKIKAQEEEKQIADYKQQIIETELYKKLSPKNQNKILTKIQEKDYKIRFINGTVEFLTWQTAMLTTGVKEQLMGKMYTYFSLYAHPSNVSVFQFALLFDVKTRAFVDMAIFNLRSAFILSSIFIADYIKVFPNALKTFNSLPIIDQVVIDCTNTMARGGVYTINNSATYLN